MNAFRTLVRAPSNIALVKYMGKSSGNLPANGSLSLTLSTLSTWMELRGERIANEECSFEWLPEHPVGAPAGGIVPDLSSTARERMERHFCSIASRAGIVLAGWKISIRTANTFPAASGIASSASSFAAATLALTRAFGMKVSATQLSGWAREGSGSACRSFAGPWVCWQGESAQAVENVAPELGSRQLRHAVLVLDSDAKSVGSSEAHARVRTSPLWEGRPARAEARLQRSLEALRTGNWGALCQEAWSEAWEMHSLFHTAQHPFTYWQPSTLHALKCLEPYVRAERPVLVTLDAGPNVHVIYPVTHATFDAELRALATREGWALLADTPGHGAEEIAP